MQLRWKKVFECADYAEYQRTKEEDGQIITDSYRKRKTDNGIYKEGEIYGHSHTITSKAAMKVLTSHLLSELRQRMLLGKLINKERPCN